MSGVLSRRFITNRNDLQHKSYHVCQCLSYHSLELLVLWHVYALWEASAMCMELQNKSRSKEHPTSMIKGCHYLPQSQTEILNDSSQLAVYPRHCWTLLCASDEIWHHFINRSIRDVLVGPRRDPKRFNIEHLLKFIEVGISEYASSDRFATRAQLEICAGLHDNCNVL